MTTIQVPPARGGWLGPSCRAMAPWLLLLVVGRVMLSQLWAPPGQASLPLQWLWLIVHDTALVLPFLLFTVGLALGRSLGHSGRAVRIAVVVGMLVSTLSYSLYAWAAPAIEDRILAARGGETVDARRFGSQTPVGILRNLEFVQTNPPSRHSLRTAAPEEFPPNVLLWRLHQPLALAVFGIANVLLGMLASELTVDMSHRVRRNARMAIGAGGGVAFLVCVAVSSPVGPFLLDGTLRSGIGGAWLPILVPLVEGVVLRRLVANRRHG